MARETLGYSRLEWVCPNCGGKNPGPQKTCSTCGSPQPENVQFQAPEKEELVDSNESEKAKSGADIHCPYCGTRNPASAAICSQCGGDLKGGAARAAGQVIGAFQTKTSTEVKCPACGSANPASAIRCQNCGAPLASSATPPLVANTPGKKSSPMIFIILGIILLVLAFGCFWLVSQFNKKTDLSATVQSVAWQRSIVIEKYGPVSKEDWKEKIPANAVLGSCEWREHHTQNEPAPNAEK
ncbi:MAG: zinc ribbon domain-containing protein, partial [Anaerolineae bacterium]|nr:zinc ribbon domain-containing protein [Anaerolineae bacterium]